MKAMDSQSFTCQAPRCLGPSGQSIIAHFSSRNVGRCTSNQKQGEADQFTLQLCGVHTHKTQVILQCEICKELSCHLKWVFWLRAHSSLMIYPGLYTSLLGSHVVVSISALFRGKRKLLSLSLHWKMNDYTSLKDGCSQAIYTTCNTLFCALTSARGLQNICIK